jgi:hypothetical protein
MIMKYLVLLAGALFILALDLTGIAVLDAIQVPYEQNFDSCVPPSLPDAWIAVETNESPSFTATQAYNSHSAPNHIILYEAPGNDYLVLALPPLEDEVPLQHISVWWWARSYQDGSALQVGILQDPDDSASFFSLTPDIPLTSYWKPYRLSLACYPNFPGRRVAFKSADPIFGGILIDDVALTYNHIVDLELSKLEMWDPYYVGQDQDYTARVTNQGINPVDDYSCQLLDGNGNILSQDDGTNLDAGYHGDHSFVYSISTPGNHRLSARVVCDGDQDASNDQSPPQIVNVLAEGAEPFAPPSFSQYTGKYPIDLYWKTSMCETLYLASELPQTDKLVHGLQYAAKIISPDIGILPIKIWMGLTTLENLSGGWIPASEMQLVFDGENDFPPGELPSYFCFSQPFEYLSGSNLAILVLRPLDTQYYTSTDDFYYDNTSIIRTRNVKSDTAIYDPYNPPASEPLTARPVTLLYVTDPVSASDDPLSPVFPILSVLPNPFRERVEFNLKLAEASPVRLEVYNLKGEKVMVLVDGFQDRGTTAYPWDGRDSSGNACGSGIYLYRFESPDINRTGRLVLVK